MKWIVRNRNYTVPGGLALLAGLAWVVFGFFGAHLLFVDDEVSEPSPVFAATVTQPTDAPTTEPTAAPSSLASARPTATARPSSLPPTTPPPTTPPTTPPVAPVTTLPVAPATTLPAIGTEYHGTFVGRDHATSGNAIVLGNGTGQRFVRFEEFETSNGPDLNVYLVNSSAGGVQDFVDLGNLKGNIGDQNYEIPPEVDLGTYDTVLIWCVRFSSPFGEATLSPT